MPQIARTATVEPAAQLADDVVVGPNCYIGPQVRLGPGCRLLVNAVICGNTEIGARNVFYPGAVIGAPPQDLKYRGADTRLVIGDDNVFREHVTVHLGTETGGGVTRIGSYNQFQVGTHVAHDTRVGDHCVVSNSVQIAGHVVIEDCVNISGLVGIQQFVTIGKFSFITGAARCTTDVPPFLVYGGFDGAVASVNEEGLRRWGFDNAQIKRIWDLYKIVFGKRTERAGATLADRIAAAESNGPLDEHQQYLLSFVKRSAQGVCGRYLESLRKDLGRSPPEFYVR